MKSFYRKRPRIHLKQNLINKKNEKDNTLDLDEYVPKDDSKKINRNTIQERSSSNNVDERNYSNKFDILVIEDNLEILEMLKDTLESVTHYNFNVTCSQNAEEAMEKIQNSSFDLIISDNVLPGMSGIDLLTKVKDQYPSILRILITGYSDLEVVKDAINRAAVNAYIEKPFGYKELTEKVIDILKEKNVLQRRQDLTSLEQIYESEGGPEFFSSLFSFTPKDCEIHTVVEKSEEDLAIKYSQERIDVLSNYGIIKKVKNLPLIIKCPNCQSYDYKIVLKCPLCTSENLVKGEIIEHYSCSNINFSNKFIKKGKLICPKCNQELRRLGVDYRKIGNWVFCEKCSEFYGEANIGLRCNSCKTLYTVNESIWEEEEKIVPDRAKILKLIRRLSILSEIEKELRKKGLDVRRNLLLTYKGIEKKFDMGVFRDLKDEDPFMVFDIYIDPRGIFSNEIKSFYNKIKDINYAKAIFVAVPKIDTSYKKTFSDLKINTIEIDDSSSVIDALESLELPS
ncbi:MAG TPA: response regulator [Methanofastidiosum sp.]|nr:response regulator [Methanofastidiosum sp.]HNU62149.1 response regulator [Methanofastidiosum sp.]